MAVAKLVCGDCNALISATDAFCPTCGARIESGTAHGRVRVCESCGHSNTGSGVFCESCGTRLGQKPGVQKKKEKEKKARVYEPWQIISAVAVLALVATLVYSELSRDLPRAQQPTVSTGGMPPKAPGIGLPAERVDLAPLERAVQAAPNDPGALLRLANAMHDNRLLPGAIEVYQKYLTFRPRDPDARTDLGICYFQLAQTDTANSMLLLQSAAKEMHKAYDGSPTHQPSAFNLGVVNLHLGDIEESNKWFRRTVELNRNSDLGIRAGKILAQHSFP